MNGPLASRTSPFDYRSIVLAVTLAILLPIAPHEASAKVALFTFGPRGRTSRLFHRQRQRPFHSQRPRPQFSEYLAAVVESDTAIRIRIDVAALPILVIKSGEDCSQARERGMGPSADVRFGS
jgi:hypothetical protein